MEKGGVGMGVTARGAEQGPRPQGGDATAGVRSVSAKSLNIPGAESRAPAQRGCERPRVAVSWPFHRTSKSIIEKSATAGVRSVSAKSLNIPGAESRAPAGWGCPHEAQSRGPTGTVGMRPPVCGEYPRIFADKVTSIGVHYGR